MIHDCIEFKKLKDIPEREQKGGYTTYANWEIDDSTLQVHDEYLIPIQYCPFCGVKLSPNPTS